MGPILDRGRAAVQISDLEPWPRLDVPSVAWLIDAMIVLHVLGAGGAVPTPTHGPAAYWLEVDGQGVLLDPGPGALVRLVRQPGAPDSVDDVDTVLLSHLHLDHTADLAPLLFAAHSVLARNPRPLQIFGPTGFAGYLARLRDLYGSWLQPRSRTVTVTELAPGDALPVGPAGGKVTAFAADHDVGRFGGVSLGLRITDGAGAVLTYSGDTGPSPELIAAARGSQVLVAECSTPDHLASPGHLCPSRIAAVCRDARPDRVVLTHLYPLVAGRDAAGDVTRACGVPCEEAHDGFVVRIPAAGPSRKEFV
jgi:ribonuclease BN (tRNA processing enzyme)